MKSPYQDKEVCHITQFIKWHCDGNNFQKNDKINVCSQFTLYHLTVSELGKPLFLEGGYQKISQTNILTYQN